MRKIALAAAALASLATPAAALAAPASLPPVKRSLSVASAVDRDCSRAPAASRRGLDLASYRAPMSGFVTARLAAARGDWDLLVRDAAGGRRLGASQGFRSREVVQSWVAAGQRLSFVACRRSGSARSASLTIRFLDVAPPKADAVPPSLVRVTATNAQLDALEGLGFDVTHNRGAGYADVIVAGARQRELLQSAGLKYTTRIADFDAFYRRSRAADVRYARSVGGESPLPSGRTSYRTYEGIQSELKALVDGHAGRVRPVVIGRSYQGRELSGVEIAADVDRKDDGRPVYFLMALHHAREWPSAEAAMEFATMLANASASDERLQRILREVRTVVVPVVNPDGYVSTRDAAAYDPADNVRDGNGGTEPDPAETGLPPSTVEAVAPPGGIFTYRRKNCAGDVPNPSFPCELQWGVDPNRNYGNLWGGPGANSDFTSQSYHGPGPFSEPETQAVRDFSRTHQVTTLMTLHNVAALVLRPPGLHDAGLAPDEERMKDLGDRIGEAAGYTSEYGWQLYDTAGTTEDHTYAMQGGYGYTIEIGPPGGAFHMPYETGFVKEWTGEGGHGAQPGKGLREGLLLAAESAANPRDHAVIEGDAPAGATLRIRKEVQYETSRYCRRGVEPIINPLGSAVCPPGQEGGPDKHDEVNESTLVVPASGSYVWHTNPSTRPFVGGGAVKYETDSEPSRTDTFASRQTSIGDHVDYPFAIDPDDSVLKFDLTWPARPEDYDLEIYRCEGACDGDAARPAGDKDDTKVGGSGQAPGLYESTSVTAAAAGGPGAAYYARVVNYLGATSQWELKIAHFRGRRIVTTGTKEAWTLTCERDGSVQETRSVIVDRGQRLTLDLPCGRPGPSGGNGRRRTDKSGSKRRPLTRAAARREYRRCVAKARKVRSAKRRKAAKRRCVSTYERRLRAIRRAAR